MNVGEKIKKMRTAKLMTQSELVGAEITRNMLSRIENGAVNPSLETVRYIASRLNVSPSFLLADEEDERIYFKHNEAVGIKKAFMSEEYRICREVCLNSNSAGDDEIQLILAECDLAIATEEFNKGNLREACEFFDEAIEVCPKTLYRTDHIVAIAGVYFRYMRRISATLVSNTIDESEVNIYPALVDEFCRYAISMESFDYENTKNTIEKGALMRDGRSESPLSLHFEARELLENGEYKQAYEKLHAILLSEVQIAEPVMYYVFCDLEVACREINDFKGAYEYSVDKIELLQKMLA